MSQRDLPEYTSSEEPLDLLLRIRNIDPSTPELVSAFRTKDFITPFVNLYFENSVLRTVLANQWRSYKYNQEYIKFLLGGYKEEEFLSIAGKYALPFGHIDNEQLCLGVSVILNALGQTLSSSDLSFLLNVDPADVNTALESCSFITKYKEIEYKEGDEKK